MIPHNHIIDSLYNCSIDCTKNYTNISYGRGVFVGLVSYHCYRYRTTVIRAMIHILAIYSKSKTITYGKGSKINQQCIPDCWRAFDNRRGTKQDRKRITELFMLTVL